MYVSVVLLGWLDGEHEPPSCVSCKRAAFTCACVWITNIYTKRNMCMYVCVCKIAIMLAALCRLADYGPSLVSRLSD